MISATQEKMTIKWRLKAVMADREIDNRTLQKLTGLHLGTIAKLRNNRPDRVDIETLEKLCTALGCQVSELLVFIPESVPQQGSICDRAVSPQ